MCFGLRVLTSIFQSEDLRHALSVRDRKRRFEMIWRLSKPKLICEADPPADDEDQPVKEKSGPQSRHGGCGNAQPEIRKSGLELWASWKPRKGEDEGVRMPDRFEHGRTS